MHLRLDWVEDTSLFVVGNIFDGDDDEWFAKVDGLTFPEIRLSIAIELWVLNCRILN
jgi:hypothetical protein